MSDHDTWNMLPCPFCGEEPVLYETEEDDNSAAPRPHRNYQVICDACEASGPKIESGMWWSAMQAPPKHSSDFVAEAKALAAWNRRIVSEAGVTK